jgi:hypothetical protein
VTPPLYSRRKRQRERAEAEAGGTSFWTPKFSDQVRVKILYAAREAAGNNQDVVFEHARYLILKDEGRHFLNKGNYNPSSDFVDFVEMGPDEEMPGVVEAIYSSLLRYPTGGAMGPAIFLPLNFDDFERQTREILEEERIAFDFSSGQMIAFESKELFQAILEPAVQLLHDPRFNAAETAYQHALEEVSKGKPGDAITDASTALQGMLVALGCSGNSLGPLIKSARNKGLLAAHDERLTKAITDVVDWVAADRSATGDAHKADKAAKADAWLMIHIVGSLIVRLGSGDRA